MKQSGKWKRKMMMKMSAKMMNLEEVSFRIFHHSIPLMMEKNLVSPLVLGSIGADCLLWQAYQNLMNPQVLRTQVFEV